MSTISAGGCETPLDRAAGFSRAEAVLDPESCGLDIARTAVGLEVRQAPGAVHQLAPADLRGAVHPRDPGARSSCFHDRIRIASVRSGSDDFRSGAWWIVGLDAVVSRHDD